ncbi:hypothetical protein TSAR_002799 [Trichomalopsis sarcophagae]|uniref:Uncharacterized protein n=1 Tax=Trichomalopsis sarcophagae TaxID=543379 RepID=A0A232F3Q1_9HYME|nr:hypothetical protein TSAR_002799 [Trichomalopsis sarcophagae]
MPLNNGYFSTNLKGLENSVTRHFFDVGTRFCVVLNMCNKKKKVFPPTFVFFSVSPTRKLHFSRRITHIAGPLRGQLPLDISLVLDIGRMMRFGRSVNFYTKGFFRLEIFGCRVIDVALTTCSRIVVRIYTHSVRGRYR